MFNHFWHHKEHLLSIGDFSVSTVRNRIHLLTEGRALEDEELKKIAGLAGTKFVLISGHLVFTDNKEDAVRMGMG